MYANMRVRRKSTQAGLARKMNIPVSTLTAALKELIATGWVYTFPHAKSGRRIHVDWMPPDVETRLAYEVAQLADTAANQGEFLMKSLLDIIVDDRDFLDNHRYEWLAIGTQDRALELDRWYRRAKVAIEFQGRQHFESVQFPTGKSNLQLQQARDRAKALACARKQIAFVEIADVELSYAALVNRLTGLLPLLEPLTQRSLFQTLVDGCARHVEWARDQRGKP